MHVKRLTINEKMPDIEQLLRIYPDKCDLWHAKRHNVLESVIVDTRRRLGIQSVRQRRLVRLKNVKETKVIVRSEIVKHEQKNAEAKPKRKRGRPRTRPIRTEPVRPYAPRRTKAELEHNFRLLRFMIERYYPMMSLKEIVERLGTAYKYHDATSALVIIKAGLADKVGELPIGKVRDMAYSVNQNNGHL